MSLDLDELDRRAAFYGGDVTVSEDEYRELSRMARASQQAQSAEAVTEYRWRENGDWHGWKTCTQAMRTDVERLITQGLPYELRTIYAAPQESVNEELLKHIAAIVHDGGLLSVSPAHALTLVRQLTLKNWNTNGDLSQREGNVHIAIQRADPARKGGE